MLILKATLSRFWREEQAATTVEYAVMLMLIIIVCLSVIQTIGQEMSDVWANNVDELNDSW